MKALSLWQPWASLMLIPNAGKRNETRDWYFGHRGDLVIHAAKKMDRESLALCLQEPFRSALAAAGITDIDQLPFGALLGVVYVDRCVKSQGRIVSVGGAKLADGTIVKPPEVDFGDYRPGRWITITSNPRRFSRPIGYSGRQGPFDVNDAMIHDALHSPERSEANHIGEDLFAMPPTRRKAR